MYKIKTLGVIAAAALAPLATVSPAHAETLAEQINSLPVAAENRTGYDRDRFGDVDRNLVVSNSLADHSCFYSTADDICYPNASEVDVNHIVALAEAWDSGASQWTDAQRATFTADPGNLWLMTNDLHRAKGDSDIAEWTPPNAGAVCGYVQTYVMVKTRWRLSVDQAEKTALVGLAQECEPAAAAGGQSSTGPTAEPGRGTTIARATAAQPSSGGGLALTGATAAGLVIGGVLVVGAGVGLVLARRRRTSPGDP